MRTKALCPWAIGSCPSTRSEPNAGGPLRCNADGDMRGFKSSCDENMPNQPTAHIVVYACERQNNRSLHHGEHDI